MFGSRNQIRRTHLMNSSVPRSNFSSDMHISLQQAVPALYLWKTADVRIIYSFAKLPNKSPLELAHPTFSVKPNIARNTEKRAEYHRESHRSTVLKRTSGVPFVHSVAQGIFNSVTLGKCSSSLLKTSTEHSSPRQSCV